MDMETIGTVDKSNYYRVLETFESQLQDALKIATQAVNDLQKRTDLPEPGFFRQIVVSGMGGSAIAGDLVKGILGDTLCVPVVVCRDYELPHFVDATTLVMVSSYSGNTEETQAALNDALERRAYIITLATGGAIAKIGKSRALFHVDIPPGLQPRQSIGYSLTILYAVLKFLFSRETGMQDIQVAIQSISKARRLYVLDSADDSFMRTAMKLSRRPVIAYASNRHFSVALRFKGQVCENAKLLAFANALPEMNHNEIVGWEMVRESKEPPFGVVLFRDHDDHPQTQKRFEIIKKMLQMHVDVAEYWMEGRTPIEKYLSAVYWGDWLSYYIALARNVDPTPVDIITKLKTELAS
jgi:glucose/mannose-6-phosphate isomerase